MNPIAYYSTNDISLAAALLAIGVESAPEPFTVHKSINSDKKIFTFYFSENSSDGKYKTGELIRLWNDPNLYNNSEHPFAYMRCMAHNREGALDIVNKAVPMITMEKGGKIFTISQNASEKLQDSIFSEL